MTRRRLLRGPGAIALWLLALFALVVLAGALVERLRGGAGREAVLLAINDVYRIEGVENGTRGGLARVRALRRELERDHPRLIVLHAGDLLFPSLLSDAYGGEQMVDVLNRLDGAAGDDPRLFVTFGNHEFDRKDAAGGENLAKRLEQSRFAWLGSDLLFDPGFPAGPLEEAGQLIETALVESGGVRVGLFSLTTDSTRPVYVREFLDPVTTALLLTRQLRARGADAVVALTHQSIAEDRELLRRLGAEGPDLIVGGHEHQRHAEEVDGRWLVKADAEARTATVVRIRPGADRPRVAIGYRFLGPDQPPPDRRLASDVEGWIVRHDREYCAGLEPPREPGCLSEEVAKTTVALVGEELEIRTHETNLGDWVADQARAALGTDVAFVNTGALRLNQDVPPGPVTERTVLELLPYKDNQAVAITITGETLQKVANRAIEDWTGAGNFLQVSGFAFRHDPGTGRATDLTLVTTEGGRTVTRPIRSDETLTAATLDFLANGGDKYRCLTTAAPTGAPPRNFRELVRERLAAAGEIAPEVEGRICNRQRPGGPCLVLEERDGERLTGVSCAADPGPADGSEPAPGAAEPAGAGGTEPAAGSPGGGFASGGGFSSGGGGGVGF